MMSATDDEQEEVDGWGSDSEEASEPLLPPPQQQREISRVDDLGGGGGGAVEGERDLFVPIFAISGIIGFFGLYTYETIRIGCLFTPFGTFGGACD